MTVVLPPSSQESPRLSQTANLYFCSHRFESLIARAFLYSALPPKCDYRLGWHPSAGEDGANPNPRGVLQMAAADRRSPLKGRPLRGPGASVHDKIVDRVFGSAHRPCGFRVCLGAGSECRGAGQPSCPATSSRVPDPGAGRIGHRGPRFLEESARACRPAVGRDGERSVAEILETDLALLGARILHDVPGKGFNLDHVVIALRSSVFVIETKTRSKGPKEQVAVRDDGLAIGQRPPDGAALVQVEAATRWLSEWLERNTRKRYPVKGAVVFLGWYVQRMSRAWLQAGRPWILPPQNLVAFVKREPVRLSSDEIHLAADRLRDYIGASMDAPERT